MIGHNSGDHSHVSLDSSNVAADELRLLLERAERLEEEKKGLADDIKDVFAEAKGRGYSPPAMRAVLKIRKAQEAYKALQSDIDIYAQALGMDL